jgi:hypothetical protein
VNQLTSGCTIAAFLLTALAAAVAPLLGGSHDARATNAGFPGWPTQYEGRPLVALPLTPRENSFVRDFPGRVGRFSDGRREIIIRWVDVPTRRLHSAADCFRGIGYSITPLPVRKNASDAAMSCFRAGHVGDAVAVCEMIRDEHGSIWPDISAWYWSAMFGASPGPWWSFVVAERM